VRLDLSASKFRESSDSVWGAREEVSRRGACMREKDGWVTDSPWLYNSLKTSLYSGIHHNCFPSSIVLLTWRPPPLKFKLRDVLNSDQSMIPCTRFQNIQTPLLCVCPFVRRLSQL
jgi:hypothetical protein